MVALGEMNSFVFAPSEPLGSWGSANPPISNTQQKQLYRAKRAFPDHLLRKPDSRALGEITIRTTAQVNKKERWANVRIRATRFPEFPEKARPRSTSRDEQMSNTGMVYEKIRMGGQEWVVTVTLRG